LFFISIPYSSQKEKGFFKKTHTPPTAYNALEAEYCLGKMKKGHLGY
jgi:hypothetical protein